MKRFAATSAAGALLLLASPTAAAQSPLPTNAQRALQWLQCTQQQPNGQIGSGGNPIARSAEVALGLAAAGQPASMMRVGTFSLADYLKTAASTDVGTNGELLLARASQSDAGPTATVAAQLEASKSTSGSSAGEYGSDIFSDALAILGLRADNQAVGQDAIAFLKSQQKADGGWSADNADQFGEDSNTTALVLQALIAAGVAPADTTVVSGFSYMQSVFSNGGFGDAPGSGPDPNSDELGIEAVLAAHLQADAAWNGRLQQALQYLAGQQITSGPDMGAIANQFSKLFATTEAPSAFLLRPFTEAGISESKIALLACPTTTSTTATPAPTSSRTTTVQLARTGGGPDGRPVLAILVLLLGAVGLVRGRSRRVRH
jgi:hypothetical protein